MKETVAYIRKIVPDITCQCIVGKTVYYCVLRILCMHTGGKHIVENIDIG